MTACSRGDVVLIDFIFPDESGGKRRPAVIVSSNAYHKGRKEAIIMAITSQTNRLLIGDYLIANWKEAGLLFPSVATGVVRTVKQNMIGRKLGAMSPHDVQAIERNLLAVLDLA